MKQQPLKCFLWLCGLGLMCPGGHALEPPQANPKWYQLASPSGVYLKFEVEPVDPNWGANWGQLNWFIDGLFRPKRVYLDDRPLFEFQGTFGQIMVTEAYHYMVIKTPHYERLHLETLLGTGVRTIDLSKIKAGAYAQKLWPESTRGIYNLAPAFISFPLPAPFRFRLTGSTAYDLPVNNHSLNHVDQKADFSDLMKATQEYNHKRRAIEQKRDVGWEEEMEQIAHPLKKFPGLSWMNYHPGDDKGPKHEPVCLEFEPLSPRRVKFLVKNQTFGKFVFVSLDGGTRYRKADAWVEAVQGEPDAVILDLDKLPTDLQTPEKDKVLKVLVAGTREWSVHALVYAWGQGWEYPPDPSEPEPPPKEPVIVLPSPLKTSPKKKGKVVTKEDQRTLTVVMPKPQPKRTGLPPNCW